MLDVDGIKMALWEWATGVLAYAGRTDPEIPVIWAQQHGTRPQGLHMQLNMAGPAMVGAYDFVGCVGDEIEQRGLRSFLVSVNVYSPDGDELSLAAALQSSLSNPILRTPLEEAKIGIGSISDMRDLSEIVETDWERRYQFDFVIYVPLSTEKEVVSQDVIKSVEIQHVI